MSIDWYTVLFQIINFLILVVLLRIFLYKPVLKIMDEREESIARRLEEAAEKAAAAEAQTRVYRQKQAELEGRETELLESARAAAEDERRRLTEAARRETAELQRRWRAAFFRQQETFVTELRRQVARQACRVAQRCLRDLADAALEEMVWRVFLEKLEALPPAELDQVKALPAREEGVVTVRSAFELPGEKLEQLRERLSGPAAGEVRLVHETEPGLICGIELEAGGYRVAWSIESYLEGLEKRILKTLEQAREVVDDAGA